MVNCISKRYKELLNMLIEFETPAVNILKAVNKIPSCESSPNTDCVTDDYRFILETILENNPAKLPEKLDKMTLCEEAVVEIETGKTGEATVKGQDESDVRWPPVKYIDENDQVHNFTSPTKAFKTLFPGISPGKKQVCEVVAGEKDCTPDSMVMSFWAQGMLVRGNGEPPPVITKELKRRERTALHGDWKDHLVSTNKSFVVIHPRSRTARTMDVVVEQKIESGIPAPQFGEW
jgi:hypothetical protein